MILEVFKNLGLGFLGILVFTAFNARQHLSVFSFKILLKENIPYWLWSLTMLLLFSIIIGVSPDSADALKVFTGLDLSTEPAAYIMAGLTLGGIAKDIQRTKHKKKIN